MKDELITILSTYGYPVMLQGSLNKDDKYPDSFFAFWNDTTEDGHHYDNDAISIVWDFTVYFYSINSTLVNTVLADLQTTLKQNGWIVQGLGYDVPTDYPTHTGRAIDIIYNKQEVKTNADT